MFSAGFDALATSESTQKLQVSLYSTSEVFSGEQPHRFSNVRIQLAAILILIITSYVGFGPAGSVGFAGSTGSTVLTGSIGSTGSDGSDGSTGSAGSDGSTGSDSSAG